MRRWIAVQFALIAAGFLLFFATALQAQDIIELHPGQSAPPFHGKIWYSLDSTGEMQLDQARAHPERFKRNTTEQINFGVSSAVIWLRLDVINTGAEGGEWLLNTLLRSSEILDVYLLQQDKSELLFSAANAAAASEALHSYDMLAAKFSLAPGEHGTLYVRYHNQDITRLPLQIHTFAAAAEEKQYKYVLFTIVAASVATFAVYSTTIFLLIGGRAILYYAIAEVAMMLLLAQFDGILSLNYGQHTQTVRLIAPAVFSGLSIIFTALFARNFFPLRARAPRVDWLLRLILAAGFMYLAATGLTAGQPEVFAKVQIVPYVLLAALWLGLPLLAIYATARWSASYWPLIPGLSSVLFAHGYWILIVQNLVPEPPFPPRLLGLNFIFQGFFMAIAIVLQVRQLRDDRLRALQLQLDAAHKNTTMLREMADQGRLVQAAGHDTRSILYGLRNLAGSLRREKDVARISQAAQDIDYLTDDLEAVFSTTMASAVSGGAENVLALEHLDILRILSALRLIHERPVKDKGLRFNVHAGAHELVTDRALLSRILGNLIDNARHYTERGGVIVAARRHGGWLRIQVWDSGHGVAPELLKQLLDPDSGRLRGSEPNAGQGSGLQTAKSLALLLGGTIAACSRAGHGSRFELVLPLAPPPLAPPAKRLWILDDNPHHGQKLQTMARELGVASEVLSFAAYSVHPGITAADLILADLNFGGTLRGIEAATQLASIIPRRNIFIFTYDQGVDIRARLAPVSAIILYQPVSQQALEFALGHTV